MNSHQDTLGITLSSYYLEIILLTAKPIISLQMNKKNLMNSLRKISNWEEFNLQNPLLPQPSSS